MTDDDLRTRIANTLYQELSVELPAAIRGADAVIRELDGEFLDFGAWLAEEITGRAVTRIDLESCLEDWKGGGADE